MKTTMTLIAAVAAMECAAGFFTVGTSGDRAMFFDPDGKPFYMRGCGTVSTALDNAVPILKRCGFNTIAQPAASMLGKGFAWTYNFNVGRRFAEKGKEYRISGKDGPFFPNVEHPGFESYVREFVRRNAADKKDDASLLGYFIDNELGFDLATDAQIDKYYEITTRVIREVDPNHLLLGCRFMGGKITSNLHAWKACARHCDVVSVNIYPEIDLYRRRIFVHDYYFAKDKPRVEVTDMVRRLSEHCGKPVVITEWSFPSYESGLPCSAGGGCRMDTQKERAEASELFVRQLYSVKCMPGYIYFRWYDTDSWSKERTNYGIVTNDGKPYEELIEAFERVQGADGFPRFFDMPPPPFREHARLSMPFEEAVRSIALPGGARPVPSNFDMPRNDFDVMPVAGRNVAALRARKGRPHLRVIPHGESHKNDRRWALRYKEWANDVWLLKDGTYLALAAPPRSDYDYFEFYHGRDDGKPRCAMKTKEGDGAFAFLLWGMGGRSEFERDLLSLRKDWDRALSERAVSPDRRNAIVFRDGAISVLRDGRTLLGPQPVALELGGGQANVELCARNDGVAYRFATDLDGEVTVADEKAPLVFPSGDVRIWTGYNWCDNPNDPKQDKLQHGCASIYTETTVGKFVPDGRRIAYLPLLAQYPDGTALWVSESDLRDYPGWNLCRRSQETRRLDGVFAKAPIPDRDFFPKRNYRRVKARHDYLAKTSGRRTYPWRVFAVSDAPIGLVETTIVRDLAKAPEGDFSWVKPGISAWEWWNHWELDDVGFKSGNDFRTYMKYIEFAADMGLAYLTVDEGWSVEQDPMHERKDLQMDRLIEYAASRGVGLVLWVPWRELIGRHDEIFSYWAKRGAKGFKVDFIERDDQYAVNFFEQTAAVAAKYRLIVDFHGCPKPTGLERTYPNIVGFEGVHGLELMKLSFAKNDDFPRHDCQVVYTRVPAGPTDYTPGGMRQLPRATWKPDDVFPPTQGTRVHQLAMSILCPAPLQFMCDSPSQYRRNMECAKFLAAIPSVWDGVKGLAGEVGHSAALARRRGGEWWIAAITDWSAREIDIDTSFLGSGEWTLEVFEDATDTLENPEHYVRKKMSIKAGDRLKIRMQPGGGWVARSVEQRGAPL